MTTTETSPALLRLGEMVQDCRRGHSMTGVQVQDRCHISQSKLSKIETGKYGVPGWNDLVRILAAIGATEEEVGSVRRQHEIAQLDHRSYLGMTDDAVVAKQRQIGDLERTSRLVRCYEVAVFPGLLQTPQYARSVFVALGLSGSEVEAAVVARVGRQASLRDPNKLFSFIFHEATLYSVHGGQGGISQHVLQLEYVRSQLNMRNIQIAVLETKRGYPLDAGNPFCIFDRRYVTAEAATQELVSTRELEVREYERIFGAVSKGAVRGDEARRLIDGAIRHFGA